MTEREAVIEQKIQDVINGVYYQHRDTRRYRVKDGAVFKRCVQCNNFKNVRTDFYWTNVRTTWFTHCKACHSFNTTKHRFGIGASKELHEMVPWVKVQPFFIELVRRLGKAEAARRIGINKSRVTFYMKTPPTRIFLRTAKKILSAVHEARSRNEIRNFKSIAHGSSARGHVERRVSSPDDLYVRSDGDADSAYRRERRRSNPEIARHESQQRMERRQRLREKEAA